jgi:hypothetical protein
MSDWKWNGTVEKDCIVVKPVEAIAVYENEDGNIVIRQQGPMGEDDSVIVVPQPAARALIKAIQRVLKR